MFGALTGARGTRRCAAGCLALAAVVVSGCAGGGGSSPTSASAVSSSTTRAMPPSRSSSTTRATSRPRSPSRPRPRGAPIGVTQRVHAGSSTLAVTVSRVIDPLPGSGSALVPGTRPVGIFVTIGNRGGATYDSTASGDWSLLTAVGPASPLFVRHGVCQTPLVDFESLIAPGATHVGCVGFAVPRRARIAGIRFSPHSRAPGAVRWRLRPGNGG